MRQFESYKPAACTLFLKHGNLCNQIFHKVLQHNLCMVGSIYNDHFTANLLKNLQVNALRKSVKF